MSFTIKQGYLYCEELDLKSIRAQVGQTPFYLYSAQQIRKNYQAFANALDGLPALISYAVKANGNLHILELIRQMGSWATLVSGNELRLALAAGFEPKNTIYNGNGKTMPELELAIERGSLVNIDSGFDLDHIEHAAGKLEKSVDALMRVNPHIDPQVHPYISTSLRDSKFGISPGDIPVILDRLRGIPLIKLVGVHCHLGSTIDEMEVYQQSMDVMGALFEELKGAGYPVKYLNLGGGLGIDYEGTGNYPTPGELVDAIYDRLPEGATLILEPGRSIIGSAGVLVCSVIGVKIGEERNFIVIDGSMAELIRPSLYQAYHRIGFIEPVEAERKDFDVVGPVCESADTLGKERTLPIPPEGSGIIVYDAGAYGYAMSSNYNARLRPPEYLVDGDQLKLIRRSESIEGLLRIFEEGT